MDRHRTGSTTPIFLLMAFLILTGCDGPSEDRPESELNKPVEPVGGFGDGHRKIYQRIRADGKNLIAAFLGDLRSKRFEAAYRKLADRLRKKWSKDAFVPAMKTLRLHGPQASQVQSIGSETKRSSDGFVYGQLFRILGGGAPFRGGRIRFRARKTGNRIRIVDLSYQLEYRRNTGELEEGEKNVHRFLTHLRNRRYEKAKKQIHEPSGVTPDPELLKRIRERLEMDRGGDPHEYVRRTQVRLSNGRREIIYPIGPAGDSAPSVRVSYRPGAGTFSLKEVKAGDK